MAGTKTGFREYSGFRIESGVRVALTLVLLLGSVAFIGILSFSGMLYLTNSLGAGIASAILAILIEGEIYKQNIFSALGMMMNFGLFIQRSNRAKKLKQLSEDANKRDNCEILREYHDKMARLKHLEHHGLISEITKAHELATLRARIAAIEEEFARYLEGKKDTSFEGVIDDPKVLETQVNKLIKNELIWLWLSAPITVLGGIMAAFVTASQLSAALTTFGVTVTPVLMSAVVWPIAALAALGFMMMIYKTFVDIIHNKKVILFWENVKEKFKQASTEKKVLYVLGMTFVIALALAATIATAGTWWSAAQAGLALVPFLAAASTVARTVLSTIGVALMSFGILLFDYGNSLESIETVEGMVDEVKEKMTKKNMTFKEYVRYRGAKTYEQWLMRDLWERINPLTWLIRIISLPFRIVLFLGHLISIGVTGDKLGDLSPVITAVVGSLQEGMTDIHYLWETAGGKHHHHGKHHDHTHSDLPGLFLNILLAPFKLLEALWNFALSKRHATFKTYLKESFGLAKVPHHHHGHDYHEHHDAPDPNAGGGHDHHEHSSDDDHDHDHHASDEALLNSVERQEQQQRQQPTETMTLRVKYPTLGNHPKFWLNEKRVACRVEPERLPEPTHIAVPAA